MHCAREIQWWKWVTSLSIASLPATACCAEGKQNIQDNGGCTMITPEPSWPALSALSMAQKRPGWRDLQGWGSHPSSISPSQLPSAATGAASTYLHTGMVPHGLEKRRLKALGQYWLNPAPLINKGRQCYVRGLLVPGWIHPHGE